MGKRAAEMLGFGFFGIEIVDQIAREQGVRRELVAGLDEHVRAAIDRWVGDGVRRAPFTETQYHEALLRTLGALSERGRVVILGRGSPYALPQGRTLRVWVVASRPYRRERLALVRGLDAAAAERQLDREEAERQSFIRHHFQVDPDDASLYDVVVNTETLGIERAARLAARTFEDRFAGAEPSRGRAAQPAAARALQAG